MPRIDFQDDGGERSLAFEASLLIGRSDRAGFIMTDIRCSKEHCRIERKGRQWRLVDLASANGTRVNGQEVSGVILADGDLIQIGEQHLSFHLRSETRPRVVPTAPAAPVREKAPSPDAAPSFAAASLAARTPAGPPRVARLALFAGLGLLAAVGAWFAFSGPEQQEEGPSPKADDAVAAADPKPVEAAAPALPPEDPLQAYRRESALLDPDLALERLETLRSQAALAARTAEIDKEVRLVNQRLTADLESRAGRILAESEAELAIGRFDIVLTRLDALVFEAKGRGSDALETTARRRRLEVIRRARGAYDDADALADQLEKAGRFEAAIARLEPLLSHLRGSGLESLLRSHLTVLELARGRAAESPRIAAETAPAFAAAEPRPEVPRPGEPRPEEPRRAPPVEKPETAAKPATSTGGREDSRILALAADAEKLASERKWRRAAEGFADLLGTGAGNPKLRRDWNAREQGLNAVAGLFDSLIEQAASPSAASRTLKLGRLTARFVSADVVGLTLKTGRGPVSWTWKEIPAEHLIDVLEFAVNDPASRVAFARAAHELGDPDRATVALVAAATGAPETKPEVDRLFAAWRGTPIPEGGFVVQNGRFFTPAEWEDERLRVEAEKVGKTLATASRDKAAELVARMKVIGAAGEDALHAALTLRFERLLAEARQLPAFTDLERSRSRMMPLLDERRKAALALIFDAKRYPYPYGPDQAAVQAEVEGLAARVREVYEHPAKELLADDERLAAAHAELTEVAAWMPAGGDFQGADADLLLRELDRAVDLRTHGRSPADRKWNDDVFTFNDEIKSSITVDERGVHDLTNEYRLMMGMRAVKIDEALVRAARGHSQEMKDKGYFAHESPVPERRTPSMRAQLAGWGGSCSENIAQGAGTPAGAVDGWLGSSGHHRNILGRGHTHLGCGKAADGFFWTQNFGSGGSSKISMEKIDPKAAKATPAGPVKAEEKPAGGKKD